jgi:uncharacterized membrane protein
MSDHPPSNALVPPPQRVLALDALRGIVIVLMALDHAGHVFDAGHYVTDSVALYTVGAPIPAVAFAIRWITHLCAPTFLFLAGWSLALSIDRRQRRGDTAGRIDAFILKRGLLILLLDPVWMSFAFGGLVLFQVLYAIGASLCCMVVLRRLGTMTLVTIGLVILLFGEGLAGLAVWVAGGSRPGLVGAFLVTGGRVGESVLVLYPLLPWLAYMILGWCCGRFFLQGRIPNPPLMALRVGVFAWLVFAAVRWMNGYGNMMLLRYDDSLLQWLHVSKYPPSLSFAALELGLMCWLLALLFVLYRNTPGNRFDPLLVFGQTSLFFYVLHVHLLAAAGWTLGARGRGGLTETGVAVLGVLALLYPLCFWYRNLKRSGKIPLTHYL